MNDLLPDPPDLRALHHPGAMVGPLWAVTVGAGPPLVLLHGNSESHRIFDAMVPLLAPHRTLVGLDSRGHGLSPRGLTGLSIASMADDVAQVLDALALRGAPVVGFSDGGNIALELALRHPGAPGPLVLVGANLFPDGLRPLDRFATDAAHALTAAGSRVAPHLAPLAERLGLMVNDPDIDPARLADVDVPVLVVAGERDAVRPEHTALIGSSLPHGRVHLVPGAGHMLPVTEPVVLARLVRDFLAEVDRGGPSEMAG